MIYQVITAVEFNSTATTLGAHHGILQI